MDNTLRPGTTLQGKAYRYRIERVLGQGTFGITYLATTQVKVAGALGDLESTIQVAVKEFFMKDINGRKECSVTASTKDGVYANYKAKFAREAENLSRLRHPHIVRVLEYFEANNTVYYAMEYVDGGSLDTYVAQKNGLPEKECVVYMEQIASAVNYMHAHKMLHLDLKPGNVMLRKNGGAVLIDFGLSKQYDEEGKPETSTSVGSGTPGYAPLEQANYHEGKDFPVTMDVYALGATLFKMLTGVRPPEASDMLNDGFPAYELQKRGISEGMIACVSKAMAPLKAQRYQSVSAFMDGFRSEGTIIDDEKKEEEPRKVVETKETKEKAQKSANKKRWLGGLVGGAIAIVVLIFWAWPDSPPSEPQGNPLDTTAMAEALVDSLPPADSLAEAVDSAALAAEAEAARQAERERLAREADPSYQVSKGKEYYDNGNYTEAVKWWRKAADQGNADAQNYLGEYRERGSKEQDQVEAEKWFRKAAEQGHADGQYNLARCYHYGKGIAKDYDEALKWYRKAAEQGNVYAQNELGWYYQHRAKKPDLEEAVKWYRKAAEQGNSRAQYELGYCYIKGKGVAQDRNEAIKWYRKAAAQGNASAELRLKELGVSY